MRWDWQIGRVTPLQRTGKRAVDIYDIDGFLTTPAQVRAIHTRWQAATMPHPKTVCYLDLAWEDYRPDGSPGGGYQQCRGALAWQGSGAGRGTTRQVNRVVVPPAASAVRTATRCRPVRSAPV